MLCLNIQSASTVIGLHANGHLQGLHSRGYIVRGASNSSEYGDLQGI